MKELLFKINDNDIMLSRLKKITVFKICVLVFLKKMKYLKNKKKYIIGKIHLYDIEKVIESF